MKFVDRNFAAYEPPASEKPGYNPAVHYAQALEAGDHTPRLTLGSRTEMVLVHEIAQLAFDPDSLITAGLAVRLAAPAFNGSFSSEVARQLHNRILDVALGQLTDAYGEAAKVPADITTRARALCKTAGILQAAEAVTTAVVDQQPPRYTRGWYARVTRGRNSTGWLKWAFAPADR